VEHTPMHPTLKKGTKNFHYTSNFCGFLLLLLFQETKIPTDMKVQVSFNFRKNKIWKKIKSPSSMKNGRFNTSKCRGKVQKMGVLYIHSPKMSGPSPNFLITSKKQVKIKFKKPKKIEKGAQPAVC
jgi:hypothetical protein